MLYNFDSQNCQRGTFIHNFFRKQQGIAYTKKKQQFGILPIHLSQKKTTKNLGLKDTFNNTPTHHYSLEFTPRGARAASSALVALPMTSLAASPTLGHPCDETFPRLKTQLVNVKSWCNICLEIVLIFPAPNLLGLFFHWNLPGDRGPLAAT